MQTEKSKPEGNWIMPETRFIEFPAFSVNPRVGISRSASEIDDWLFFLPIIKLNRIITLKFWQFTLFDGQLRRSLGVFHYGPLVSFVNNWRHF